MRGLGHCPTEAELEQILQNFGAPQAKTVAFADLVGFLAKRPKEQNIEDELIDAFCSLQASLTSSAEAAKNEYMQINFLKKLLMESGEPFSERELDNFTEFLNTNGLKVYEQEFNYRNFCKILAYAEMEN